MVDIFEVNRTGEIVWRLDDSKASHDVDLLSNRNTIFVRAARQNAIRQLELVEEPQIPNA